MRHLLIAAVFAGHALGAHAATWSFSYAGATSVDAPFQLPSIDGQFVAQDIDLDGHIGRQEVQQLEFFGHRMAPATDMGAPGLPPGSVMSELWSFDFDLGSEALSFTGRAGAWHDSYVKSAFALLYETGIGSFTFDLSAAQLDVQLIDGTSSLQALPVPEPGTWALLAMGLALIGWHGHARGRHASER
ncbi:MAG: PEP-CTERM sorting domain-containing protein [Pseudomonadota bacterium]